MAMTTLTRASRLAVIVAGLFFVIGIAQAQELKTLLDAAALRDQQTKKSQAKIDEVVAETRDLASEFKGVNKELEGLTVYNTLLQRQIDDQMEEMEDLRNSIDQVTVIERQIMPLMLRMIEGLEEFVKLDVPFLKTERENRINFLKDLMERADVTVPEKFRRLLEAYQIENDYGRTIEAYKGTIALEGGNVDVDFLKIGRIALLYLSNDTKNFGAWDQETRQWVSVPTTYRNQIRLGLRIARKQVAPNLLTLPVAAPEDAQ